MSNKIKIFDTTLRDGDQAPGFAFSREQKVAFARQLVKLGVDVIEAGFAASSQGDYNAIENICKDIGKERVSICSLARANEDVEIAAKSLEQASNPRIHTFIATSDIHIEKKFKKTRQWVLDNAIKAVRKAKNYLDDVEFSCEDFSRSNHDFVIEVISEAIKNGATTINLPDTVGCFYPYNFNNSVRHSAYDSVKRVIESVRNRGLEAIFSVHNHNDLGMATANTLAGIYAGARQIEVTLNGIGERAGNTALEEIVAAIKYGLEFSLDINSKYLAETSKICSNFTGQEVQRNKAIVGENAFMHEAGIHQDGIIKHRETYECLNPEDYGYKTKFWIGKKSGSAAIRNSYEKLGIKFDDDSFKEVFVRFKELADTKKRITDRDLINLVRAIKEE